MTWREYASPRRTRPPQVRGALARPRLSALLHGQERIAVLSAPAGYGKTTTLAAHLPDLGQSCWYTLDADDADPHALAAGLVLCAARLPGIQDAEALLDRGAAPYAVVRRLVDTLLSHDALLVLDEAQHLPGELTRELLGAPRLALLSRTVLDLPDLHVFEARSEVRHLGSADLSFDVQETQALLRAHGVSVDLSAARLAHSVTEGWPIAARFLAQALAGGRLQLSGLRNLEAEAPQLSALFAYLAQEVLGPLEPTLREFLTRSSVFEVLTPDLLHGVLGEAHAGTYLEALARGGTFLTREGAAYRAHPLLRAHLRAALARDSARELASRGAAYFEQTGQPRPALQAHLQAGNATRAGQLLVLHGERWLAQGRSSLVERSLERVGEAVMSAQPALFALLGDVRRLQSRYDEALHAYEHAPEPVRIKGQARIYLDTVQPARAEVLLERAAGLTGEDAAGLPVMRAENALNAGKLSAALQYWPPIAEGARFALRSGNLERALMLARRGVRGEVGGQRAAQNHREALLLESLLCALTGDLARAEQSAQRGIAEGERLESPFVQSLAYARFGHARLAGGDLVQARSSYEQALSLAQDTAPRLLAEPLMGLAFLDPQGTAATQALSISESSGDCYMSALVRLTFALGLQQARHPSFAAELGRAREDFQLCGDAFGQACADLALYAGAHGDAQGALQAVQAYPFLLSRPSLFTPARTRAGRASLLSRLAREAPEIPASLRLLAHDLGYADVPLDHPGVEVRVQLLGRLAVRRDGEDVRDWGRAKARELLALLTVYPQGVSREAAQEALYPDLEPEVGERNFRIVLHALGTVLEPAGGSAYFLERGEWLRLRASPDLSVDLWDAWQAFKAPAGSPGRAETLFGLPERVSGVALTDVEAEAERYASRLPEALVEEASLALAQGDPELATRLAERSITVESAHEPAARVLMRAHYARGHLGGVMRTYQQCRAALGALDLTPMPETEALYRALRG